MVRTAFHAVAAASLLLLCSPFLWRSGRAAAPAEAKIGRPDEMESILAIGFHCILDAGARLEHRSGNAQQPALPRADHHTGAPSSHRGGTLACASLRSLRNTLCRSTCGALAKVNPKVLSYLGSFGSAVFRFDGLYADNLFAATIVRREVSRLIPL